MPTPIVLVEAGRWRPMTCRACGGDGISADVHPRIAAAMRRRIVLRRATGSFTEPGAVLHVQVSSQGTTTNGVLHRPLAMAAQVVQQRHDAGYVVVGDIPDLAYACERCKGTGEDPLTLTRD